MNKLADIDFLTLAVVVVAAYGFMVVGAFIGIDIERHRAAKRDKKSLSIPKPQYRQSLSSEFE